MIPPHERRASGSSTSSEPPDGPLLHPAVIGSAVALVYALSASLAYSLAIRGVVTLWIPGGMVLGVLLTTSTRRWPAILVGAFVGNLTADLLNVSQPVLPFIGPVANIVESTAAAWVVRRLCPASSILASLRGVGALVVGAAILSNAVTALLGGTVLIVGYGRPASLFWSNWLN